jgi:hypothetical protein
MQTETAPVAAPQAPADAEPVEELSPADGGAQGAAAEADAGVSGEKAAKPGKDAKAAKKAGKKGKGKKGGGDAEGAEGPAGSGLSLAAHPRAARRLAEAKAWGALGGFVLGGYLSLPTHTLLAAGVRALAAGVVCWVVVWAVAVFLWRRLVVAELRHAEHELLAARLATRNPAEPQRTLDAGGR